MSSTKSLTVTNPQPSQQSIRARHPWRWFAVASGFIVFGCILFASVGPTTTDTHHQAFDGAVNQLIVDVDGDVAITAGDTTNVTVVREWALYGAPTTDLAMESGVLSVTGVCPAFAAQCTTNVTATVAPDAEVVVKTSGGAIAVSGSGGGVDLSSSGGQVEVNDVYGPARLITSAGSIRGSLLGGDVDAKTSAGNIDLTVSGSFERLSAITSAGSVDLTVPDYVYLVDADTSAGQVHSDVRTDPNASKLITARSSAGDVTVAAAS